MTSSAKAYAAVSSTSQAKQTFTVRGVKVGAVKVKIASAASTNYEAATLEVALNVVPAAVTKLTAVNLAKGIRLKWAKTAGASGYYVYRGSTKIATIKKGTTVTYTDTKANTNRAKYIYKIVAYATLNKKAAAGAASKTLTAFRLARPAISSASNTAAGKMTVKWAKNAKATGYQIQYSTSSIFASGNKAVSVISASTVSKVISGLTKGNTCYVRIRTYKTVGSTKYWSAWSVAKTVKITK